MAALRITHEEGLSALTVRRLCAELSVGAPTVYYHAGSMQELYELVSDAVIAQIEVPLEGSWQDRVIDLVARTRAIFARHPGVAAFVNGHHPLPAAIGLADATIGILLEELDHSTALTAYHVITVYNMGQMLIDGAETASKGRPVNPTFLPHGKSPARYRSLSEVRSVTGHLDPGDTHLQGLRWILFGARHNSRLPEEEGTLTGD
ncbi:MULTISPECIES: TetR/AcrR family transcriptional regulator [Mycobacterium]|uniref:TetR family transcriptional regulator n=1 Tax=Mycobacterium paraseoulense TaxID=590652 RepID=A0A1X0IEY8_9MYCO|nr:MULTISPECIES: helix-turn-helix domain-containing protein [Mycobacterium]MCV7393797.1 helix-turn-helix transcriptional regulator [Mycobacterium paraseoulense]OBH13951.1 hypothetical protein A9X04_15255 [Mycobacterium sp. E3247]OBH35323.1 hypothetical protein A5692_11985 [Mycobacterium sp. E342]ORB45466.1 TetR family transcriptional regulator [Mycobacterium paraseoulense]BBZ70586.1 hypothetical protein MPRS_16790 [Mycobacterium paraseoulense]